MFPSTIIIGSKPKTTDSKIKELCLSLDHNSLANNPDLILINSESGWGIDQVRTLKKFFSQKPFNHQNKIIIIQDAHNLNAEAQNALLKILEEPGPNHYIFLVTNQPFYLLPTILSRCQTIRLTSNFISESKVISPTNDLNKNLKLSEDISQNKEDILPFLEEQLFLQQKLLVEKPSVKISTDIQKIIKSIQMIKANVDPKSALDYYFLA